MLGPNEIVKRAEELDIPDRQRMDATRLRNEVNRAIEKQNKGTDTQTADVPVVETTAQPGPGDDDKAVQTQERKGPRRSNRD